MDKLLDDLDLNGVKTTYLDVLFKLKDILISIINSEQGFSGRSSSSHMEDIFHQLSKWILFDQHGIKRYKKKVRLTKLKRDKDVQLLKEQGIS